MVVIGLARALTTRLAITGTHGAIITVATVGATLHVGALAIGANASAVLETLARVALATVLTDLNRIVTGTLLAEIVAARRDRQAEQECQKETHGAPLVFAVQETENGLIVALWNFGDLATAQTVAHVEVLWIVRDLTDKKAPPKKHVVRCLVNDAPDQLSVFHGAPQIVA